METSPNFTPKVQQIIVQSKNFATTINSKEVNPDHLLLVVLETEDPTISEFLKSFKFTNSQLKNFVISFCGLEDDYKGEPIDSNFYGDEFNQVLSSAVEFSRKMGHSYVCIEHIFFSLLNVVDGPLYSFFFAYDVSPHFQ